MKRLDIPLKIRRNLIYKRSIKNDVRRKTGNFYEIERKVDTKEIAKGQLYRNQG